MNNNVTVSHFGSCKTWQMNVINVSYPSQSEPTLIILPINNAILNREYKSRYHHRNKTCEKYRFLCYNGRYVNQFSKYFVSYCAWIAILSGSIILISVFYRLFWAILPVIFPYILCLAMSWLRHPILSNVQLSGGFYTIKVYNNKIQLTL